MKLILTAFCIFGLSWSVQCSKILFLSTVPTVSHFKLAFRLAKELADRGHEVTVVNSYPQKHPIKNYRDIPLLEAIEFLEPIIKTLFQMDKTGPFANLFLIYDAGLKLTELTYENENVKKLLNSNETFDVVIIEQFANEALLGIAHHFNAPSILISGFGASTINNHFHANPAPSSYIQNIMMGVYIKRMTFWERLENFGLNIIMDLIREFYLLSQHRSMFKKYIKSDIELDDIMKNVSIILSNSHVSIHDSAPQVPNIVNIAGYHLFPTEKLPQDLQNYLDNCHQGFILFAMGSNLKMKNLSLEKRNAILKAFSKIKQNVLWKFEEQLDDMPSNVKILDWLPQQDVLAHQNIRAFITHGGMLSTVEAVTFGVPMIGIPVFGDQMSNIAVGVAKGFAINLPLSELTEENLFWALNEIINNPKYRKSMEKASKLMNDRPLKPIDEAVYWIEHVVRHNGTAHFKTSAVELAWYQREMVDIFVFIIVVLATFSFVIFLILKRLYRLLTCKKIPISNDKKKNL